MIRLDHDLCILDCETLGLDPLAPVWEFAAVRLDRDGHEVAREEFLIDHDRGDWLDTLPEWFVRDYRARYWAEFAAPAAAAARHIAAITDGAIIAGSNPSFDTERLERLLRRWGIAPGWHYHGLDIPSMALGWLADSVHVGAVNLVYDPEIDGPVDAPWKSDQLSQHIGINPADHARHTAMGDVQWCLAQWRAMTGQDRNHA